MKGLVYKDLQTARVYVTSMVFLVVIFGGVSIVNPSFSNMLLFMVPVMIIMISINTFSYDDATLWDSYALTLSLNRSSIVLAKYLLVVLLTLIGSIIAIIIPIMMAIINGSYGALMDDVSTLGGVVVGVTFVIAVTMPFIYKFGSDKARIYMLIACAATGAIAYLIIYLLSENINIGSIGITLYNVFNNYGLIIGIAFMLISLTVSYKISCRIYEKKDL